MYLRRVKRAERRLVEKGRLYGRPVHIVIAMATPDRADEPAAEARGLNSLPNP